MRRAPLQYQPNEPGWWLGADGLWYPPETNPGSYETGPAIANAAEGSQNVVVNIGQPIPGHVTGSSKSKVAAGLLGIFVGALGAHRFYTGHTGLGITMLLLTVLSFGVLAPFIAFWGFIEGVMYLAGGIKDDANGAPLT
jgi:TM2 domain-containing membrane protein YozV